jgi:thiol-disulfide isomerase/thioredoxin
MPLLKRRRVERIGHRADNERQLRRDPHAAELERAMFKRRMPRHGNALFVLMIACAAATAWAAQPGPLPSTLPAAPPPALACDAPRHDFGSVREGSKLSHTFTIRNVSDKPVRLSRSAMLPGLSVASEFTLTQAVPAGQTVEMPVVFDTSRMSGPVTRTFLIGIGDSMASPISLQVTARVEPYVKLSPAGLAFGRVRQGQRLIRKVELSNNSGRPLKLAMKTPPTSRPFAATLRETEPGQRYTLDVAYEAPMQPQTQQLDLHLTTNVPERPEIIVPCTANVVPRLEVVPQQIIIPPNNDPYTMVATFRNNGDRPVAIQSVTVADRAMSVTSYRVSPTQYSISLVIPERHALPAGRSVLEIRTDDPTQPLLRVPIFGPRAPTAEASTRPTLASAGPGATRPVTASRPAVAIPTPQELLGKPAPAVTLKVFDAAPLTLGGPTEQAIVLVFWRQSCPHCRRAVPLVDRVYQAYYGKPVRFIGVNQDVKSTPQQVRQFAAQLGMTHELAQDSPQKAAARAYGIRGVPTVVLIAPAGTIEAIHRGERADLDQILSTEIDLLLAGKIHSEFPPLPPPPPPSR